MCIALIGGMDRLERHYIEEAERAGVDLRVFNKPVVDITAKLKRVDAMVIFTNKVSHRMKREAANAARAHEIPVYMHHACGICYAEGLSELSQEHGVSGRCALELWERN